MEITLRCACGASLSVQDSSEIANGTAMRLWFEQHPHNNDHAVINSHEAIAKVPE